MLRAALIFGAGYVLGSKAGRERYAQIKELAEKAAAGLEGTKPRDTSDRVPGAHDLIAFPDAEGRLNGGVVVRGLVVGPPHGHEAASCRG